MGRGIDVLPFRKPWMKDVLGKPKERKLLRGMGGGTRNRSRRRYREKRISPFFSC